MGKHLKGDSKYQNKPKIKNNDIAVEASFVSYKRLKICLKAGNPRTAVHAGQLRREVEQWYSKSLSHGVTHLREAATKDTRHGHTILQHFPKLKRIVELHHTCLLAKIHCFQYTHCSP